MSQILLRLIVAIPLTVLLSAPLSAEQPNADNYDFTIEVAAKAITGWQLYTDKQFAGSFNGGHYTDADPETRVKDFWSDGVTAILDRDGNGRHETIFKIVDKKIVYVGSLNEKGVFAHTAIKHKKYSEKSTTAFMEDIAKTSKRSKKVVKNNQVGDEAEIDSDDESGTGPIDRK